MSIERLKALQFENDKAGAEMLIEAGRFERLANRHLNGFAPRAISSFNLFQTPIKIAELMASKASSVLKEGARVLEPSAGLGRLYKAVFNKMGDSVNYTLVENNPQCMAELYTLAPKAILKQSNFLETHFEEGFDLIIMNPPFKQGRDIKHILHAKLFLNKGGLLISLCYNGVRQNKELKPISNTWEALPENSFKEEGTNASVAMLTIQK